MTFKIKMLTAAAVLSLPAVAGAQVTGTGSATGAIQGQAQPPVSSTVDQTTQPVQSTTDSATQALPDPSTDAAQPAEEQVRDTTQPVQDAVDQATAPTPPEAGVQANTQAQAQTSAQAGPVSQATAADVTAGAAVRDQSGAPVGTIESVSAEGAVISTGSVRAQIPITSFGKDAQGLVIAMTRTQLEAAAGARSPG